MRGRGVTQDIEEIEHGYLESGAFWVVDGDKVSTRGGLSKDAVGHRSHTHEHDCSVLLA